MYPNDRNIKSQWKKAINILKPQVPQIKKKDRYYYFNCEHALSGYPISKTY